MINNKQTKSGVYLLPNVLTTFGLFCGFLAIIWAIKGEYAGAAMLIFAAMLWDALDGRVARLTNSISEFGAQYDSMADMLSFCIAPAMLIFFYLLADVGKIGWIAAFIYITAGALRLARFNAQINQDKHYFQGLPSPAAAALIAGMVWAKQTIGVGVFDQYFSLVGWTVLVVAGILMVSNIRYYSFKEINLKGRASFKLLLIATFIIIIVALEPSVVLFVFFLIYALSGPILTISQIRKKRQLKKRPKLK